MRSLVLSVALLCCATILSAQSFSIDVDPPSQTTTEATSTWTVSVTPTGGFSAPVFFRARPIGMSATSKFAPESVRSPYTGTTTMTLTYNGLKNGSTYQIEVEGYNGIATARDTVSVTVPNKSAWRSYSAFYSPHFSEQTTGRKLVLDNAGNCWFGGRDGLTRLNGTTPTIFKSIAPGVTGLTPLAADGTGLWVCTNVDFKYESGLARYDGTTWTRYDSTTGVSDSVISGIVVWGSGETFAMAGNGNLWAWTNKGLMNYDGTSWKRYPNPMSVGPWTVMDQTGGFWLTGFMDTPPYYWLINFDGSYWQDYTVAEVGFPTQNSARFLPLGVDPNNRLWTTHQSPNTLYIMDIATKTATEFTDDDGTGNVRKGVTCVSWDASGNVWIGHGKTVHLEGRSTPGGVHRWDGTRWWYYTKENSGLLDNNVYDIEIDRSTNTVWILTETGIAILDGNAAPSSTIFAGVEDRTTVSRTNRHLVSAYPNPTYGSATVRLDLSASTHVRLTIVSPLGEAIGEPVERRLDAGPQHVDLDLSGMAPGAYFIRAAIGDRIESLPLTVIR